FGHHVCPVGSPGSFPGVTRAVRGLAPVSSGYGTRAVVGGEGFEPPTFWVWTRCSPVELVALDVLPGFPAANELDISWTDAILPGKRAVCSLGLAYGDHVSFG